MWVLWSVVGFMALDSSRYLYLRRVLCGSIVAVGDGNRPHHALGFRANEVDRQQSVFQVRRHHPHTFREHEGALKLARRDPAVEILPGFVVLLPATDEELVLLDRHVELFAAEARDRQRDAQPFRLPIVAGKALD